MRATFRVLPVLALTSALGLLGSGCKSAKQSAQLRDEAASAPLPSCPLRPDSTADDAVVPNDGDLVGCTDDMLAAEKATLPTAIGSVETTLENNAKLQDKAEGKKSPGLGDKPQLGDAAKA